MTFCGYDPEMGTGLWKFGKGVASSTLRKAAKAGRSIKEQVEQELIELEILLVELRRAESDAPSAEAKHRLMAMEGLTLLCQAAFLGANKVEGEDASLEHVVEMFAQYGDLVRELEDAYEASGAGVVEGIKAGVAAVVSY